MAVRKVTLADGSTRWRLRVFIGRDADGKQTVVTRTFDKKKEADAEDARLRNMKARGTLATPSKIPLSDYLGSWLDNVKSGRIRDRTLHDYRAMIRRYIQEPPDGLPPVGKIRLDQLTGTAFETLYAHLWTEMKLSPRTLQLLHSILRQALAHAVNTGALPRNPTDAVKPPRQAQGGGTPEKAMRAMSQKETKAFLKAAEVDEHGALWITLLMTGIRPGEAFALKWEDVDLDGARLNVSRSLTRTGVDGWKLTQPKTARARRSITLPQLVVRVLRAHRKAQAERRILLGPEWQDYGFIFTATFGTPLDLGNVNRRFRLLLEKAKLGMWKEPETEDGERVFIPGFRLYDLRHTHASHLLASGENVKVVSERLGHASVTLTLDTYSHVLPGMQEQTADRLDAMYGAGS